MRVRIDGEIHGAWRAGTDLRLDKAKAHFIEVVVDRLVDPRGGADAPGGFAWDNRLKWGENSDLVVLRQAAGGVRSADGAGKVFHRLLQSGNRFYDSAAHAEAFFL